VQPAAIDAHATAPSARQAAHSTSNAARELAGDGFCSARNAREPSVMLKTPMLAGRPATITLRSPRHSTETAATAARPVHSARDATAAGMPCARCERARNPSASEPMLITSTVASTAIVSWRSAAGSFALKNRNAQYEPTAGTSAMTASKNQIEVEGRRRFESAQTNKQTRAADAIAIGSVPPPLTSAPDPAGTTTL
jgi:hypothetical protein